MAEPFIAEIRIFPFNYPPRGWAWCDGQLLPISQNTALFSLIGTTYGGDGKSNFGLPNLQGRAAMHSGHGPGLSTRSVGESGGTAAVTIRQNEMPAHTHTLQSNAGPANRTTPTGNSIARADGAAVYAPGGPTNATLAAEALPATGGEQPHNNLQPYLTCYFNIALVGIYPPRP